MNSRFIVAIRAYLRTISVLVAAQGLIGTAKADSTAFPLCTGTTANVFSQNWTTSTLITANDNWSGVPSITGHLGDISAGSATGVDPRTLTSAPLGAVDVIANQSNPNTLPDGGVAEFDLTNDVVALQGSGTADAPSLVITLNNSGTSNTTIAYTVRDIDGSVDNANQQFNVQYRIGISGPWINVPGGYIADASAGPSLTQDTPVAAYSLPSNINNAGTVQLRFMTTNAATNDEWLGVDDIVITPTCSPNVCAGLTPSPYILPDNTPETLRTAIECANANGTADIIDLNGQTVTLTDSYYFYDGETGLPRVDSELLIRNGTITRSGANEFRLLQVGSAGILSLQDMTLTNGGGATYSAFGGTLSTNSGSSVKIWRSSFTGASVSNSLTGGGIFASGEFVMANSRVQGNIAGRGGGIALQNGPATITNSVISGNVATSILGGGAMYIIGPNFAIINSTITGNYATASGATRTGGILSDISGADLILRNSILWGNTNGDGTGLQIANDSAFGSNTVTNSIVQGGQFGGLNSNPLFATPLTGSSTPSTAGNFQLLDASPAIDAGANANVPADTFDLDGDTDTSENAPDLAGNVRRFNDLGVTDTGSGTAPLVDLGAYEKQTNSPGGPCQAITFPYTLPDNAPATLIAAIECANANGPSADTIDLNGQIVTLTAAYADYTGATGLPQINTTMTLQNGTISRSGGSQFRLINVGVPGNLTLNQVTASNGYGLAPGSMGGGGAVYNLGALNIVGGQFSNNYSAMDGGAIHNDGGAVNARYTVFSGNSVNTSLGGVGGGLANSFGVVTLSNVLISGNLGVQGAGIYNNNSGTLTLNNSTIAGNSTNDQGAGLRNENTAASVVLNNTIISGNESSLFPATSDVGGSITNNFSLIGGSPAFVAPLDASSTAPTTAGNYRLADFSPAIDAGSNSLVPGIITTDLDGNPRRYNDTGVADTGSGTAPIVDLGAYEKQTNSVSPCAAVTFPYTLPNNAPATLITAIECANANGSADVINLNGQTVTLTASYASYTGATGLPQVTTAITLQNGTITRSGGAPQFRLLNVGATGSLTLDGVTVSGGSLPSNDNAGAIFNDGGTLTIVDSTVANNSAGFGGALYNSGSAAAITITDSTLSNNSATQNGGFMMNDSGSATIIRSTVSGNSSSGTAGNGAIYNFEANLDIVDSTFTGNTSTTSVGAVQNFAGTTNIANSEFAGNSAANTSGAVLNNAGGVMTITNSMFTGNRAGNAAGALTNNVSSTLRITNGTFAGNSATTGGGIFISGATTTTITNSVVWGNSGNTLTGATITYSVIEGGFAGTGNLNVDPLFVSPLAFTSAPTIAGNYRLQDSSPAVDAGSNAAVPVDTFDLNDNASTTDEAPDLDGNPRRYNDTGVPDTGSGTAPIVDMGAFEKQTNSPPIFPMDVDFCNLRFPTSFAAAAGSTSPFIYGRIFEDDNGVLTSSPGAHPSIVAQVGHGPLGSDPRGGNPAWLWIPATFNLQVGNDDEYQATFIVPFAPTNTQRSYTYRFSVDNGANYTYCDTDGNGTNGGLSFSTANLGTLTIDSGGQPTISINDVSLAEGNSGVTPFSFTVSLNGPSLSAVTFDIATANNTATVANGDYVSNSQTGVVIPAGQTSTTFTVLVNRDTTFEPNETFFVNLTNIVGAVAGDAQGMGTIVNDDVDPCAGYTFPYTMTGNTPAELIQAINCANANGASPDTINLNGQTVTLTEINTSAYGSGTGLPEITTAVVIQNGTITRNSANLFRFFVHSGSSSLTLNNITLSNGNPEWDGGAIWGIGSPTLIINNSRIVGNSGNFGGAIFIPTSGTAVITNTLLSGNRASSPGGAIRNRGNLTLNNSTIAANFTTAGTEGGGGIANNSGTVVLNNSIVHGNEASSFPATNDIRGTFTANNSFVGVNPSFVNLLDAGDTAPTTGGDYRLAAFSLATDAGSNSLIPGGVTTDLDGNPRRYNDTGVADTGVGSAPIVDIGAYERQTNSVLPQADVAITKTNGTTSSVPGASTTYTITASNAGPGSPGSATVADTFPASLTCTWTCVGAGGGMCTAAGAGNINDSVNLPSGGSVTYTASCTISAAATGSLSNTATVSTSMTDPNTGNNSATDTDTLSPQADVRITKTDGTTSVNAGSSTVYTITASNAGPSNAQTVTVSDTFPAACVAPSWTCAGSSGGTCALNGTGNINESVTLPAGGSVSFSATCPISAAASGSLSNTATVAAGGVTDPSPGNNSATDTNTVIAVPVLSIDSVSLTEGDSGSSNLTFTVTRSTTGTAFDVAYATADGSAVAGSDYTTTNGVLTFAAGGAETQIIEVPIIGNNIVEGTEAFTVTLSNATGNAQIGTAVGTGTITDNDSATVQFNPVTLSQSEATSPMVFTVTLSNPVQSGVTLTVNSTPGTATSPADFAAISGGTVSFAPNSTTPQAVNVVIANDGLFEGNEAYTLALSNLVATGNVTLPPGTATATGTITNDDVAPTITISAPSVVEGNPPTSTPLNFVVSLNTASGLPVNFNFATNGAAGTATAGTDYTAVPSTAGSIAAGQLSVTLPVSVLGDVLSEGNETVVLALSGISNANVATLSGTGTINDDDVAQISISDAGLTEGDSGSQNLQFTVSRSGNGGAFSVDFATSNATATAGSDYTSSTGTLSFTANGAPSQVINVPITGESLVEVAETFTVTLSNVVSTLGTAAIDDGSGTGTITDNDSATVQFAPTSLSQSEATSPMAFTVTLTNPVQSGVTVTANSTPGTATAADFTAITNATVTFPPNSSTAQTVNVVINNDALDENDEQFTLTLSGLVATGNVTLPLSTATATGTIQDDDATPTLSVANVAQPEGNASNTLTFTASLSAVSGRDVTFTRATQDGTAVSTAPNADFVALPSALVTIPAGTQSVPIPVTINGDTNFEGDQSFALNLTSIVNATPGSLSATGTLQDDDQQPTTTTITSDDPDASLVGQPYTVNVTVAAQTLPPAGTITVSDGTSSCGPVNLVPGTASSSSASCQLTSTTAGAKTLTATYAPANTAFAASSDTELHQVNAASTTLSVTGPARVRINTPATYTIALAAVAPGGGTPSGTVTVTSGANSCTVTLPATTCNLSFASLGSRTITASYVGNANYSGATSSGSGNASTLVFARSDVQVTKSSGDTFYEPGELQVYTIQLRNAGPDVARNLRLLDTVPAELSGVQWSCDAAGGAVCPQNAGTGNIDQTIAEMPLPGLLNYTLFGTVIGRPDQISNTASVQLPADSTIEDPTPGNNSQTDVDQLNTLFRNGFEAASINAASGSFILPSAALRSALDGVALSVFRLDDKQGSVLRVYARTFNGEIEYALATRGSIGWQLGSWQRFGGDPTLRWTATRDGEGWRLQSATLQ